MTGNNLQVHATVSGVTYAVDQYGNLVSGGGYQFSSPADALTACQVAVANNDGVLSKLTIVTTPG